MSARCVALLRGINVGRAKRVAMADLRALFEQLAFTNVRTLLNSGNIVFTARSEAGAQDLIEAAITRSLGISSRVTVLTAAQLAGVVRDNPLLDVADDPARLQVTFLRNPADRKLLTALTKQNWKPETIAIGTRAAYLWCPGGTIESKLFREVSRVLGDEATSRNWATVTKLHALRAV